MMRGLFARLFSNLNFHSSIKLLIGLVIGICLALSLAYFAGESPLNILRIFFNSAFGSRYDLGLTLFYTTSFIYTGLSVCIAFHGGLFNIGAEGQLNLACISSACAGTLIQQNAPEMPPLIAMSLILLSGLVAGAIWGFVPGWLKSYRRSHEVIVTMMMNFIAAAIASYLTLELFRSQESQNPETQAISSQFLFKDFDFIQKFFTDAPVNLSLLMAIFLSVALFFFLYRSQWGFKLRAAGLNPEAAEFSGIPSQKLRMLSMVAAGTLAGFVTANEILGSAGKYRIGFSADYGFVGIAVALLARNNPLGILLSAFLFGILQKGSSDLDIETQSITRDFARIMQAIIILSVAGFYFIDLDSQIKKIRKIRSVFQRNQRI